MSMGFPGAESPALDRRKSCIELYFSLRLLIPSVGFGASVVCFFLRMSLERITVTGWQEAEDGLSQSWPQRILRSASAADT